MKAVCHALALARDQIRAGAQGVTLTSVLALQTGEKARDCCAAIREAEACGLILANRRGYRLSPAGASLLSAGGAGRPGP